MQLNRTPCFEDFFDEKRMPVKDYLDGIPTILTLIILAFTNGRIHKAGMDSKSQFDLFNEFIADLDSKMQVFLKKKMMLFIDRPEDDLNIGFGVFSSELILELMLIAVKSKNIGFKSFTSDYSPKVLLKVFKALMALRSEMNVRLNEPYEDKGVKIDSLEHCQLLMWPTLLSQSASITGSSLTSNLIKGILFLHYLSESEYLPYLREFLEKRGYGHHNHFILDLSSTIFRVLKGLENERGWLIQHSIEKSPLPFEMREEDFIQNNSVTLNFIRTRPLIRIDDQNLIVADFNLFISKMYDGLIYDIYNETSFSKDYSLPRFKSIIGLFTQQVMFNRIWERIIAPDFRITKSEMDKESHLGYPDYYLRNGNHIYLFEIKDIVFKDVIMDSCNIPKIEKEILSKVASFDNSQGVGQQLGVIKKIDERELPFDHIQTQKLKKLVIHPILIHSNHYLRMPGINVLIADIFEKQVLKIEFKNIDKSRIKPPILIHSDYFFKDYFYYRFRKNEKLDKQILKFSKKLESRLENGFIAKSKVFTDSYLDFNAIQSNKASGDFPISKILKHLAVDDLLVKSYAKNKQRRA